MMSAREQLNQKELARSGVKVEKTWSIELPPRTKNIESIGDNLFLDCGQILVISPSTGKVLSNLPHITNIQSDGKLVIGLKTVPGKDEQPSIFSIDCWDLRAGKLLSSLAIAQPSVPSNLVNGEYFVFSAGRMLAVEAKSATVMREGALIEGGGPEKILATPSYVYTCLVNSTILALQNRDLARGKSNQCICHPVAVMGNRLVVSTNFMSGMGTLALDGSDFRSFRNQIMNEGAEPRTSAGLGVVYGQWLDAHSPDRNKQVGTVVGCFEIPSGKLRWKKFMRPSAYEILGVHLLILRDVVHANPSRGRFEIRNLLTGMLEYQKDVNQSLDGVRLLSGRDYFVLADAKTMSAFRIHDSQTRPLKPRIR